LGWTCLNLAQLAGLRPARPQNKKNEEEEYVGSSSAQPFWADISPPISGSVLGPVSWAGPAHIFNNLLM